MDLLKQLFSVIWLGENVPRQWRVGLIVNIFKKGDREHPGNPRGGKTMFRISQTFFFTQYVINFFRLHIIGQVSYAR